MKKTKETDYPNLPLRPPLPEPPLQFKKLLLRLNPLNSHKLVSFTALPTSLIEFFP